MDKKLLILDVDETLIHGSEAILSRQPDHTCSWCHLYLRPHVLEFIRFCFEHFRVAIWSTASMDHIEMSLHQIGCHTYPFEFIWDIEKCTLVVDPPDDFGIGDRTHWRKNLSKLKRKGFLLEEVLMVDDSTEKLDKHFGNLVRIRPFFGSHSDRELLRLMPYLLELKSAENVRVLEKRGWESRFPI
ncbi:HAD family hydrolase [Mariprofundus ferrooxydans]|uniref:HAD family hydrolase n=1 Tax=Mariprofundus ferrooxydans TaxID=314344 RepID=UPI000364121D|nr:HAD family hydrolase [Mariprofundus ferrooxydans]